MASTAIRERRRTLRYRNLLVRQMVQMKTKISALLMEAGVSYNQQRLHKVGYFRDLLATNPDIDEGLASLLRLCRETVVRLGKTESALVRSLERDPLLVERVERLMTIPAVGPITALMRTRIVNQLWALAMNEGQRRKKKLWSEQGRAELEKLSLAPWAGRRRRELLELLDRLNPTIEELTAAAEQEAQKRPDVLRLMTHASVATNDIRS